MMNDLEKKCYCFVLQCYFGDMADPVNAAIDRAYVDMASHTLKGFAEEEYRQKWKCRYCASKTIKKAVQKTEEMRQNYNSWHNKLCNKLQSIYVEKAKYQLTYGQAQKWVNMATKYLLVFAVIFKDMDCQEKLDSIPNFFREADAIQKLHIPLDSFIMQQYKVNNFGPWSKMNREQYEACRTQIKDKTLQDELEDWGVAANLHRADEKKSYAAYVKEQKER